MMKKLTAGVITCLMLGALAANVSAVESPKTLTIPRVPDGSIDFADSAAMDEAYTLCPVQEMTEQNLEYFSDNPCNSTGKFWSVYDSKYLYVYVEVKDEVIDYSHEDPTQTWNRESVGVMLDFDYIREEAYEYNYATNGDNVAYLNFAGDFVAVTYHIYANDLADNDPNRGLYDQLKLQSVSNTGDGRILYEMALPFPEDFDVEEGAKFGFEVIATNAQDGERQGVVSWSPEGSEMWHYTDVCGTAILGAAPAVEAPADEPTDAPVGDTTAPVTADAGIVAAAAVMAAAAGVVLSKKRR